MSEEEDKEAQHKDTARWVHDFLKYYENRYKVPKEKSVLQRLLERTE